MILTVISVEIAALKFIWLSYGVLGAVLFLMFGIVLASYGSTFMMTGIMLIFEFDENSILPIEKRGARIARSILQFFKSFVFALISFEIANFLFFHYTIGLSSQGQVLKFIARVEVIVTMYYAFYRSRKLLGLMKPSYLPKEKNATEAA